MPTVTEQALTTADGTEQVLAAITDSGVYVLIVHMENMLASDQTILRVKQKVLSGGALQTNLAVTFDDAQVDPDKLQATYGFVCPQGMTFTLEQTAGTNRDYDWSITKIGEVTVESSGTKSVTTSESTIGGAVTTNRVLALLTDHDLQPASCATTLRAHTKARETSTLQEFFNVTLATGVLVAPDILQESAPVLAPFEGSFSVIRAGGSDYNMPYAVCSISALAA